jgi:hypothetical protein
MLFLAYTFFRRDNLTTKRITIAKTATNKKMGTSPVERYRVSADTPSPIHKKEIARLYSRSFRFIAYRMKATPAIIAAIIEMIDVNPVHISISPSLSGTI